MACPDNHALVQLLLSDSHETAGNEAELWQHVEQCAACRADLNRLSDDVELQSWRDSKRAGTSSVDEEAACQSLVERLVAGSSMLIVDGTRDTAKAGLMPSRISTATDSPSGDLSVLETLQPSLYPEDLGMLGHYRIVRLLGQGGMAIVLEAIDTELGRTVALKILRMSHSHSSSRERFLREARALAGIRHPHVVSIHSVSSTESGLPYLTMELVAGETLERLLDREREVEPKLAAAWVADIAAGLSAAHKSGLVHRDIKPSNILLAKQDDQVCAKLADFGLARFTNVPQSFTHAGVLLGTPAYMSPEHIATPEKCDARSDVYSLGVTLYEMLTGELPFRGTVHTMLQRITTDQPLNVRTLNSLVAVDLDTICMKAMHREPPRRYATADEFAEDLRRYLQGRPIRARRASQLELMVGWCRRNQRVASLLGVVAGLLLALASVSTYSAWTLSVADRALRIEKQNVEDQAAQLKRSAEDAQKQRQIAIRSLNDLVTKTQSELGTRPGTLKVRDALLDMALQGLEEITDNQDPTSIDSTTIEAHLRKGEIYEALGKNADTVRELDVATKLAESLWSADNGSTIAQKSLASALMARADLDTRRGALDVALPLYERAEKLRETSAKQSPDDLESQRALGTVLQRIADVYFHRNQWDQAQPIFAKSLSIAQRNAQRWPGNQSVQRDVSLAEQRLGTIESLRGRLVDAMRHIESAIDINRLLLKSDANNRVYLGDLAFLTGNQARITSLQGDFEQAILQARQAIEYCQSLANLDPLDTDAKTKVGGGWLALHDVLFAAGKLSEAAEAQREFVRNTKELADAHPTVSKFSVLTSHASYNLAGLLLRQGKKTEALEALDLYVRYLERCQQAVDASPAYYAALLALAQKTQAAVKLAVNESDALESPAGVDDLVLYIARGVAMYEAARQGDLGKAKQLGEWIKAAPASDPLVATAGSITVARAYSLCVAAAKADHQRFSDEEVAYFSNATIETIRPLLADPTVAKNPSMIQSLQKEPDFQAMLSNAEFRQLILLSPDQSPLK